MASQTNFDSPIPARWLPFVRATWVVFVLLLLGLLVAGLRPRYDELVQVCDATDCAIMVPSRGEAELLESFNLSLNFYALFLIGSELYLALVFSLLAVLIFLRRSDTWIGILVSLTLFGLGLNFFVEEPRALMRFYPDLLPFVDFVTSLAFILFILTFLLFPDGRFRPRWLGWLAAGLVGIMLLDPLLTISQTRLPSASTLVVLAGAAGAITGILSQVYRYRSISDPSQRQQTKWVLFGLLSMFSMALLWLMFIELFSLRPGPARLAYNFSLGLQSVFISFFPISVAFSILRYRLWDIDLLIRRTLVYGSLTALLLLVFFGLVTILQSLFTALTNQQSPISIVISTLAIAALFNPLRHRLQGAIDRRFYRQRYDAEQAVAAFAAQARDETQLSELSEMLAQAVAQTMQPEHLSVWLLKQDVER